MTARVALGHGARALLLVLAAIVTATALPGLPVLPDLVLPVVAACALVRGRWAGLLVGLLAGWTVDLVPPTAPVLGAGALVYGAAGFAAGAYDRPGGHWRYLPHVALVSAVAAALAARVVVDIVLGTTADPARVLGSSLATAVLGLGLVPLLVRAEVAVAPWHRPWRRGPR